MREYSPEKLIFVSTGILSALSGNGSADYFNIAVRSPCWSNKLQPPGCYSSYIFALRMCVPCARFSRSPNVHCRLPAGVSPHRPSLYQPRCFVFPGVPARPCLGAAPRKFTMLLKLFYCQLEF